MSFSSKLNQIKQDLSVSNLSKSKIMKKCVQKRLNIGLTALQSDLDRATIDLKTVKDTTLLRRL